MSDDNRPWWALAGFDWNAHESARRVESVLSRAYADTAMARRVLLEAGLRWPVREGAPTQGPGIWRPALEELAKNGWLFELMKVVLADPAVEAFHEPLRTLMLEPPDGHGEADDGGGELHSAIRALGWIETAQDVRARLDSLHRVAMIEVAGRASGTGFLVGDDLLLTAAHVVDARRFPPAPSGEVIAVFDFLAGRGSSAAETGHRVRVVSFEPTGSLPTAAELKGRSDEWQATSDTHLDFLVLKLEHRVALDPMDHAPRGYYNLRKAAYAFEDKEQLRIPQHPLGQTQVTSPAVGRYELNNHKTRLRYYTNALPGSSGSPVIQPNGAVVAIHHYGGSRLSQGVPIEKIANKIAADGVVLPPYQAPIQAVFPVGKQRDPVEEGVDPSPFETNCFGKRPFASRQNLRETVKGMLKGDRAHILYIEGGEHAGKSYSYRFLTHLEASSDHKEVKLLSENGIRVIKIDLDRYLTIPREKLNERIMEKVIATMQLPLPEGGLAQAARGVMQFSTHLEAKLQGKQPTWWLFFDSLDRHELEQGNVDELIAELGILVDEKRGLPLRLVLCSRSRAKFPGELEGGVEMDTAEGLTQSDVVRWLSQLATERGHNLTDAAIGTAVTPHFPQAGPRPPASELARLMPGLLEELCQDGEQ